MVISRKSLFICILIILFVFQSGLESIGGGFSYIDESVIIIALYLMFTKRKICKSLLKQRKNKKLILAIAAFFLCGLIPCIRYQYQPISFVLQDISTNTKFFFSISMGYLLIGNSEWKKYENDINKVSVIISYAIFIIFLADRVFNIYSGQYRYGIKSSILFYHHSTYLAGAMAFLLVCLATTYKRKNVFPMTLDAVVMAMTLRSKAIAAAIVFFFLFWFIIKRKKKLKAWQIVLIVIGSIAIAWNQIEFYFIRLSGRSARSVLLLTSFRIMRDYFPFGTGFGTFASHSAALHYSPVYFKYGFDSIWEVSNANQNAFLNDTFWPIIFGQTGFLGTLAYFYILLSLIRKVLQLKVIDKRFYMGAIFSFVYLIISSMAEPAFNNSIAVPLGFMLGMVFRTQDQNNGYSESCLMKN